MAKAPATRKKVTEAELRALCFAQGLTIAQMAERVGLAPTTIRRRFADLEIRARPRGAVARVRRRTVP